MKKIMLSIIVIGCLLVSSIVSLNAYTKEPENEKTMLFSNEKIPIIKNVFNKNDYFELFKTGDIYSSQEPLLTDFDGNLVPAYFETWLDSSYLEAYGYKTLVYDGYLYQGVDVWLIDDYWDIYFGILKYNASDGSLCDFKIFMQQGFFSDMVILDDNLYVCGSLLEEAYSVLLKYNILGDDITFEEST